MSVIQLETCRAVGVLSIGAVALMAVSRQAALVWGREDEMERSREIAKSMQM